MKKISRKKKTRALVCAWSVVMAILVIVMVIVFLANGRKDNKDTVGNDETSPSSTTVEVDGTTDNESVDDIVDNGSVDDLKIETKYCTLYYPGKWESHLETEIKEEDKYTVSFYANMEDAEQYHLFDVVFDSNEEMHIGQIETNDGSVDVSVILHEMDVNESYTEEQKNVISAMLEDVNHLISKLSVLSDEKEVNDEKTISVLDTPYGSLMYPAKWEENITVTEVSEDEYTAEFYGKTGSHEEVHLFDISFGVESEDTIGTIKDKDGNVKSVNIKTYDIALTDDWTEEERNEIYAMAEDINVVLDGLSGGEDF